MIEAAKRILSRIRGVITKEENTKEENVQTSPMASVPSELADANLPTPKTEIPAV